jgi:hypothetical protein
MAATSSNSKPGPGKKLLIFVISVLLLFAVLVAGVLRDLPLPVRLSVAATDLLVSAVLFVYLRQRFPR